MHLFLNLNSNALSIFPRFESARKPIVRNWNDWVGQFIFRND